MIVRTGDVLRLLLRSDYSKSFKIAFCSIISALSVALMLLTGIITIGTYALSAMAGLLMATVMIEFGYKYAFASYFVTSMLSVLIVPDKEAVLLFLFLFGYYPIIKAKLELIRTLIIRLILKLIIFNSAVLAVFYLSIAFLSMDKSEFEVFGLYLPYVFLIAGNVVFLMYDYALTGVIRQYILVWRDKIRFLKR